ncbi:hypothetical protein [Agromyces seonyuensis]|uniref:EcsC family protein n=1 Tax=Agromyces seonyuensis TaxID=2662446 RepID=A0A6I4P657_9MICO|nr:hypothetical protein [Agromyces seonyuensis]MWB99044.1 hypothetical protein [Agromyces seonyuensis]
MEPVYRVTSLPGDAPREPGAYAPGPDGAPSAASAERSGIERMLDRVLEVQRPVVLAHLRSIRRHAPGANPAQLVRILERRYLAAVTTGGAAVGATAVIPGIGTATTLALSGVETAGFLEATALFGQSVAEVHGIAITEPDRARALVTALLLGKEGSDLVQQFASQSVGVGIARSAYWGELITSTLPKAIAGTAADSLKRTFIKRFAAAGGAGWLGKALPFGVGAVIGGVGNQVLGRRVLATARTAFGTPPDIVPAVIEPGDSPTVFERAGRLSVRLGRTFGGVADRARSLAPGRRGAAAGEVAEASAPEADPQETVKPPHD